MSQGMRYATISVLAASLWAAGCAPEERTYDKPVPPAGVGCAQALICDDFEGRTAGSVPDGDLYGAESNGKVLVDTTRAVSGKQSVKLMTQATDNFKAAMLAYGTWKEPLTPDNVFHGRMNMYVESTSKGDMHWSFLSGLGIVAEDDYQVVYRYGGQIALFEEDGTYRGSQLIANYDTPSSYNDPPKGPSTSCYKQGKQRIVPVGVWTCVEWMFDGPNKEMRLWLDGEEVSEMHVLGTGDGCENQPTGYGWQAPVFSEIFMGWESYTLDEPRTMWIDDVAIGRDRIGCN
jgi:hypothetical protein